MTCYPHFHGIYYLYLQNKSVSEQKTVERKEGVGMEVVSVECTHRIARVSDEGWMTQSVMCS